MDTIIMLIIFIILASIGFWAVDGCYKLNEEEGKKKEGKNMSKKIYKGYELIKAIADGEIKENSRIDVFTDYGAYITTIKYKEGQLDWKSGEFNTGFLCSEEARFELIEDETIDIESIEELDIYEENVSKGNIIDKINELVQAVKQLNKEIKSIKEK